MAAFRGNGPLILYGSETGNAEDIAYSLYQTWQQSSPQVEWSISSVEDFDVVSLHENKLVIFVVSTCGDGEFPITMRGMWNYLLRKSLPTTWLSNVQFAVFGLGGLFVRKIQCSCKEIVCSLTAIRSFTSN